MPAFRDDRRGGRWRYRKWIQTPNGRRIRIQGTPPTDTKVAAEAAERVHIDRVLHPERVRATADVVPERKEIPTVEEFADRFNRQQPAERARDDAPLRRPERLQADPGDRRALPGGRALGVRGGAAGVDVPVSESGVTMPWHSLRHTFGTECAARGVPVPVIKELMGHSSIATTMRYVTVTSGQLDAAIRQAFGQQVGRKAKRGVRV